MNQRRILRHFKQADSRLYPYVAAVDYQRWLSGVMTKGSSHDYFYRLCREIIGQQLSGKAADTIVGRFDELFEHRVTPEKVIAIKDDALRQVGMSWAKSGYVKNIARAFRDKTVMVEQFGAWDDATVIEQLTKIKGVGRWTAEMFLIFTLGREDVFSLGDLGLRRGLEKIYGLKNHNPTEVVAIVEQWKPYRSYGSMALWQSLEA